MSGTAAVRADQVTRVRYVPALDGLRALSVTGVILFHFGLFLGYRASAPGWLRNVNLLTLNIQIFFVLSGALITSLLVAEQQRSGEISLRKFYLRRSRRLGPALVVVLPLVAAIAILWPGSGVFQALGTHPVLAIGAVCVFFGNWVLFSINGGLGWLGPAWTLGIEEQFYLTWPVLLRFALRRRMSRRTILTAWAVLLGATLVVSELILRRFGGSRTYYATPANLPGILIGCALGYELTTNPAGRLAWLVRSRFAALVGFVGIAAVSYKFNGTAFLFHGGYAIYGVFACLLVGHCFVVTGRGTWITRALSWRPLVVTGLVSYEAYLIHIVVIFVVLRAFPGLHVYPMMLLDVAVVAAASLALYYLVDQPIRQEGWGVFAVRGRAVLGRARVAYARRPIAVGGFAMSGLAAVVAVVIVVGASGSGPTHGAGTSTAAAPGGVAVQGAPVPLLLPSASDAGGEHATSGARGTSTAPPLAGQGTAPHVGASTAAHPTTLQLPTITGLTAAMGSVLGQTAVTIHGTGFTPGTKVFFGDYEAPGVRRGSDAVLMVAVPTARLVAIEKSLASLADRPRIAVTVRTAAGTSAVTPLTELPFV